MIKKIFKAFEELSLIIGKTILILIAIVILLFTLKYINNHITKIPFVDKFLKSTTIDKNLVYPMGY